MKRYINLIEKYGMINCLKMIPLSLYGKWNTWKRKSEIEESIQSEVTYQLQSIAKKKIAIYSAVLGGYDKIVEPQYTDPFMDYYIFTDKELSDESKWIKVPFSFFEGENLTNNYQKVKWIKMHPHRLFPDYQYSIWIDGNIEVLDDLWPFIDRMDGHCIAMFEHPFLHHNAYRDARLVMYLHRVNPMLANRQMQTYKKEGFPEDYGMMYETSLIAREHHDPKCIRIMESWWEQLERYTLRDQFSLTYVLWKNGCSNEFIKRLGVQWRANPRLRAHAHTGRLQD